MINTYTSSSGGDIMDMTLFWLDFVAHQVEKFGKNNISDKTQTALIDWLVLKAENFHKYSFGLFTGLEKAFHHLGSKYWKKGIPYGKELWIIKHAYQALNWNENFKKKENERTYQFIHEINIKLHNYMLLCTSSANIPYARILFVQHVNLLKFQWYCVNNHK